MSFIHRRVTRAVASALLIIATLAAAHQHKLVTVPPAQASLSQPDAGAGAAPRAMDCAVCRALQSTEPALDSVSDVVITHAETSVEQTEDGLAAPPRTRHSPRGPPALRA